MTMDQLTAETDYETARNNAQLLANTLHRQAYLILGGKGIWYAKGRKEYYQYAPCNPRERENMVIAAFDPERRTK